MPSFPPPRITLEDEPQSFSLHSPLDDPQFQNSHTVRVPVEDSSLGSLDQVQQTRKPEFSSPADDFTGGRGRGRVRARPEPDETGSRGRVKIVFRDENQDEGEEALTGSRSRVRSRFTSPGTGPGTSPSAPRVTGPRSRTPSTLTENRIVPTEKRRRQKVGQEAGVTEDLEDENLELEEEDRRSDLTGRRKINRIQGELTGRGKPSGTGSRLTGRRRIRPTGNDLDDYEEETSEGDSPTTLQSQPTIEINTVSHNSGEKTRAMPIT